MLFVLTERGKIYKINLLARNVRWERYPRMNNKQAIQRVKSATLDFTIHTKDMMDLVSRVRKQKKAVNMNVLVANLANTKTILKKLVIVTAIVPYVRWVNLPTIVT